MCVVMQQLVLFILLWQISSSTGRLVCPYNAIRLIDIDDVNEYVLLTETQDAPSLSEILNTRRVIEMDWSSHFAPNQGNLTFKNCFVIERLSSRGKVYVITNSYGEAYITNFTLSYQSSMDDGMLETYSQRFIMNTVNEALFVLKNPIMVKKLVLDIHTVERPNPNDRYYWYLNLFGCLCSDATTDTAVLPTCTTHTRQQVTDQINIASTNNVPTCASITPANDPKRNNNCSTERTIAIILPAAMLLILIIVIVAVTIIVYLKGRANNTHNTAKITEADNAIKHIDNQLYSLPIAQIGTIETKESKVKQTVPHNSNRPEANYEFTNSSTITQEQEIPQNNGYSMLDHNMTASTRHQYEEIIEPPT